MNSVSLIGRHAKDPELRYTETGKAVCNFTLAVRNPFDPENPDFINMVVWGAAAEMVAEKHAKGNMMGVTGRVRVRNYERQEDGQRVYVTEINVQDVTLIDTKDRDEHRDNNGNGGNHGGNSGNGNGGNRNSRGNGNRNGNAGGNRNGSGNRRNSSNGNGNGRGGNSSNRNNGNGRGDDEDMPY